MIVEQVDSVTFNPLSLKLFQISNNSLCVFVQAVQYRREASPDHVRDRERRPPEHDAHRRGESLRPLLQL